MRRVVLRSLWAHRRRLGSTILAIVLGVAFMAATFILSSTLDQAADDLFAGSAASADAVVRGAELTDGGAVAATTRAALRASVLEDVREVDGVLGAAPLVGTRSVGGTNRLLHPSGYAIGGSASELQSWIDDDRLAPNRIVAGRAPAAADELVLDLETATYSSVAVGDVLSLVGQFGPEPFRLVGFFEPVDEQADGRAVSVGLTLATAQRLAGTGDAIDAVLVAGDPDLDERDLARRLQAGVADVDVATGDQARKEQADAGSSADVQFFQVLLQVFGVVSVLVGSFVIANTFSILVSQRTRELALLRTLGASRAQVFASVLAEALLLGLVGSVIGLLVGTRLAGWLEEGMGSLGLQLPVSDLVVHRSTVVLAFVVGVGVTGLAALLPALRATRVLPVAALREVEAEPVARGWRRVAAGAAATAIGGWACAPAWRGDDADLARSGTGAGLLVVGIIVLGPSVVGRAFALPRALLSRATGLTGRLACDNAVRSPRRTSITAGAVLITTALIVLVSAFAASAVQSVRSDAERGFVGDFLVTGPGGLTLPNGLLVSTMPPSVVDAVRTVPGVELATGMGYESARITYPDGTTTTPFVSSIDPEAFGPILRPRMAEGRASSLDDDGIVLDHVDARRHGVGIGDEVRYAVGSRPSARLRIVALSDDPNLLGHATVTRDRYVGSAPEVRDVQVGGSYAPGSDPDTVLNGVRAAILGTPDVWVVSREVFVADVTDQIRSFVNVLYALLVLSVLISIVGVANTLSLTIHERTRELGLLRAIGMDRASVRSAIRQEAMVLGALGTAVGLVVGFVASVAVVRSLRGLGLVAFELPTAGVVVIGTCSVALTVVASLRPAIRAARVSILEAIAAP